MDLASTKIAALASSKMRWASERQKIVAENIANADTPRYRARDLVPFSALLAGSQQELADAIYAAGLIWKAGSACRHAHDCCGCRGYYTPKVVGRKGRALLISQNYYSNY